MNFRIHIQIVVDHPYYMSGAFRSPSAVCYPRENMLLIFFLHCSSILSPSATPSLPPLLRRIPLPPSLLLERLLTPRLASPVSPNACSQPTRAPPPNPFPSPRLRSFPRRHGECSPCAVPGDANAHPPSSTHPACTEYAAGPAGRVGPHPRPHPPQPFPQAQARTVARTSSHDPR
jgi:hypothetical protein